MKTIHVRSILVWLVALGFAIPVPDLRAQNPPPAAPGTSAASASSDKPADKPVPDKKADAVIEGASPGIVDVWAGGIPDRDNRSQATLRDTLCVQVLNLDDWVATLNKISIKDAVKDYRAGNQDKMQQLIKLVTAAKNDMALVINGYVLEKVHPLQSPLTQNVDPNTFQTFVFKLSLLKDFDDEGKRRDFLVSLRGAMSHYKDRVTIGIALPEPGSTRYRVLTPVTNPPHDAPKEIFDVHTARPDVRFDFVNGWRQSILFALIGALAVFFLWLAKRTDVIRDPLAPLRPDGEKPFSLARAQMAFWFFLVASSYVYLWLITASIDGLNKTALMLIGIPSLTALGAFAIDAGRSQGVNFAVLRVRAEQTAESGPVDLKATLSGKTIPAQRQRIKDALKQREDLSVARSAIPTSNSEALTASDRELDTNQRELLRLQFELDSLEYDLGYLKRGPVAQLVLDWLTENQSRTVSFHRFQMVAWTFVLSIIFLSRVLDQLTMPEFSDAVLGLMGISAGTYLGFRLPDQKPA
jgi:hypothetical protein